MVNITVLGKTALVWLKQDGMRIIPIMQFSMKAILLYFINNHPLDKITSTKMISIV